MVRALLTPPQNPREIDWTAWFIRHAELDRDMSAGPLHANVTTEFLSALSQLCEERAWRDAYLGREQFFAYDPEDEESWVSPDAYLLQHTPPEPHPDVWRLWDPGVEAPRFALEVVSDNTVAKDYDDNPGRYASLGVEELCIVDPRVATGELKPRRTKTGRLRVPLQLFRREDEHFVRVYAGPGPVFSKALGVWLLLRKKQTEIRLRLAHDSEGLSLVPTQDEALAEGARQLRATAQQAAVERARADEERARADEERARADEERARANEERARAERLALELAALRAALGK